VPPNGFFEQTEPETAQKTADLHQLVSFTTQQRSANKDLLVELHQWSHGDLLQD